MMKIVVSCLLVVNFLFAQVADLVGKDYASLNITQETCPIKNVPITKHKEWLGYVQFKNGDVVALSAPKYAFAYYIKEKDVNKNDQVHKIYMTDHKTGKIIDADGAFYVFGSRIMSVGGDDIIPFEKESDAKEFLEKQSGKKIFGIDRMNANFINYLEMR